MKHIHFLEHIDFFGMYWKLLSVLICWSTMIFLQCTLSSNDNYVCNLLVFFCSWKVYQLQQETTMKSTKNVTYLVLEFFLYWLIIANFVTPIICMDSNQQAKGILNASFSMPCADIPIISLATTRSTKSSKAAYSQVSNSF